MKTAMWAYNEVMKAVTNYRIDNKAFKDALNHLKYEIDDDVFEDEFNEMFEIIWKKQKDEIVTACSEYHKVNNINDPKTYFKFMQLLPYSEELASFIGKYNGKIGKIRVKILEATESKFS